jgi:hypothetical protein
MIIGMAHDDTEDLPSEGESARDHHAYKRYLHDVNRGKSLLQPKAVASQMTGDIRRSWSPRSFTAVNTPEGRFDAVVCNASYHFHKHGQKHGSIRAMTRQAVEYFAKHRQEAVDAGNGLLRLPNGSLYEQDGRIVTYVG